MNKQAAVIAFLQASLDRIMAEKQAISTKYDSPSVEAMRLLSLSMFNEIERPIRNALLTLNHVFTALEQIAGLYGEFVPTVDREKFLDGQIRQAQKIAQEVLGPLHNADPDCAHELENASGGGVKCRKCPGWFCY